MAGIVPMAFIGRTSTVQMQDPVESLAKQLRLSRERLPDGFVITRYFWDVESGGTDLDARSQTGTWRRFAAAGIPRDGGMAELRVEIKTGTAPYAGVICENIERAGRDTYDALKLEYALRTRNTGDGKNPGQRKVKAVPREHWTWAADGNEHPALVSMELWEAAQVIGRQRGNVADHQD